ncbi:terminase small subunit [Vagococcus sp. PNs007]|uniref:Terminase small subunit n=1 Tax=Vagococcus proximus TaxID=2991417 RepID=A0ABT5X2M6_9ENTE|nr:terminase small subunit [Vagococcus proximus]
MITNEKHKKFADEWLIDMNGTRAYKSAYIHIKKDTTAATNAGRLLRDAEIKKYIDERLAEMQSARMAEGQEVLEYLTSVMRGEMTESTLIGLGEGVQDITEIEISAKDRIKSAELLGKRYSLFTDKVSIDGDMSLKVVIDYGE